jgi:uncharacterized protein
MTITVEVAYAKPEQQAIEEVTCEDGCCLMDAIKASGILQRFPEIDPKTLTTGVFGVLRPLEHPLREGDRVEIYRPLLADPRIARRARSKNR